jgi:hypothetical protein
MAEESVVSSTSNDDTQETITFGDEQYCSLCLAPFNVNINFDELDTEESLVIVDSLVIQICIRCRKLFHAHCVRSCNTINELISVIEQPAYTCSAC